MKNRSNAVPRIFELTSFIALIGLALTSFASSEGPGISPAKALEMLKAGNERYVNNERSYPHLDAARLKEVAKGQHPYATIITCSDSRVPPEHVFDVGLGDVFIIRVAGNVCDTDEVGSIEYGVDHLRTPVLVVLGHTHCGAVTAVAEKAEVHGSIPQLVDNIQPAVDNVKHEHPNLKGDEFIAAAVKENVWQSIEDLLKKSEASRELVHAKKLKIIGAIYHLEDGKVEWLGPHPKEKELIKQSTKPGFIHSVYFWLKDDASQAQKDQLIHDCKDLLGSVKTVLDIDVGVPAGTERTVVDNSYGVNLILKFSGKEGHDYYQTSEKHLKFIERNKDTWERVQVYDAVLE